MKIGELSVSVIEARNLPSRIYVCSLKVQSLPDPMKTSLSSKSATPCWNQLFTLNITDLDRSLSVVLLYLKGKGLYSMGQVEISLNPFRGMETTKVENWYKFTATSSEMSVPGEIHITCTYEAKFAKGNIEEDTEAMLKAVQENVLRSLQTSQMSTFQQIETSVLEEQDFLNTELKRLTRIYGPDSAKTKTVENMLLTLGNSADELKLKGLSNTTLEEIDECMKKIQDIKVQQTPENKRASAQLDMAEEEIIVVSGELTSIISGLTSKQTNLQKESLMLLNDRLTNDSDKRSFVHGGGITALLHLLSSSNDSLIMKSLEQLEHATFFESGRGHRDLKPSAVFECVYSLTNSQSKHKSALAWCIICNLLCLDDKSLFAFFTSGKGKECIITLLNSSEVFLQLRSLWAISMFPHSNKSTFLEIIWDRLMEFIENGSMKHQARAVAVIANFAADESSMEFFSSNQQFIPFLLRFIPLKDQRTSEALRALTNLSCNNKIRSLLMDEKTLQDIISILSNKNYQTQCCWLLSNLAVDRTLIDIFWKSNVLSALLNLLKDEALPIDTTEKIIWTLINLSDDERCKKTVLEQKGLLTLLKVLRDSNSERIIIQVLDLLSVFSADDIDFAKNFGEQKGMNVLVDLLKSCSLPQVKENICWAITRFSSQCTENQEIVRSLDGLSKLCDLVEEGGTYTQAAIWAIYTLIVYNNENKISIKNSGIFESLVSCLQDERACGIAGKTLSVLSSDEEAKRKIVDVVVRDVRTRKISFENLNNNIGQ